MSLALLAVLLVLAALVVAVLRLGRKAGPSTVPPAALSSARLVHRVAGDEPGGGWRDLGSCTEARGLDLRFDHPDDSEAGATLLLPEDHRTAQSRGLANVSRATLGADFTEEHVHTAGWVFRLRLRGTGGVVGRRVKLLMHVGRDGLPWGGVMEADGDDDPAVGDWIEVAWIEFLRLGRQ